MGGNPAKETTMVERAAKKRAILGTGAIWALALALGLTLSTAAIAQEKPKAPAPAPASVGADKVIQEQLNQTIPVIGRFVAAQAGVVAARTAGPIAEFKVMVGDRVKPGDVLAVLDKDRLKWALELQEAEVSRQEATVRTRRHELEQVSLELKRIEGLKKSAAFSQARFEDKRAQYITTQSKLAEAEADLKRAKANEMLARIGLREADILAPYAGVIAQRNTEVGAYVNIGQAVATLINDQSLELEADVPAERLPALREGTRLEYATVSGKRLPAEVRAIVPDENPSTRTRTVRFVTIGDPPPEARRAANQSVTLHIPSDKPRTVVTVHKDAVLSRQGNTVVFIVLDGKALIRPVRLGDAVGQRFEVLAGLNPGDLVVVRGNERLRPGQAVTPKEQS